MSINKTIKTALIAVVSIALVSSFALAAKKRIIVAGGPAGGTFQIFANAVQVYGPIKKMKNYTVKAQASGGATENLRLVDGNRVQMGVSYFGVLYSAMEGTLKGDSKKYQNTMAVGFLYGSPAQLVVKKNSGIKSVKDLIGKRVGVGNAGSGAFANAEQFFTHLGIWDKIERNAMGYNDAAQAFGNNQLDAFWLLTAYPAGAVIMAAQNDPIMMVNVQKEAEESGYFKKYPYFSKVSIPAGTYTGVDTPTPSFDDAAIWIVNKNTPADMVYEMMKVVYSDAGNAYLKKQSATFASTTVANGTSGIKGPFHPGAVKFWKEKGQLN